MRNIVIFASLSFGLLSPFLEPSTGFAEMSCGELFLGRLEGRPSEARQLLHLARMTNDPDWRDSLTAYVAAKESMLTGADLSQVPLIRQSSLELLEYAHEKQKTLESGTESSRKSASSWAKLSSKIQRALDKHDLSYQLYHRLATSYLGFGEMNAQEMAEYIETGTLDLPIRKDMDIPRLNRLWAAGALPDGINNETVPAGNVVYTPGQFYSHDMGHRTRFVGKLLEVGSRKGVDPVFLMLRITVFYHCLIKVFEQVPDPQVVAGAESVFFLESHEIDSESKSLGADGNQVANIYLNFAQDKDSRSHLSGPALLKRIEQEKHQLTRLRQRPKIRTFQDVYKLDNEQWAKVLIVFVRAQELADKLWSSDLYLLGRWSQQSESAIDLVPWRDPLAAD